MIAATNVRVHDPLQVVLALLDAGAEVDARRDDGFTALMLAASLPPAPPPPPLGYKGRGEPDAQPGIVQSLIGHGANVNMETIDGDTPLRIAIEASNAKIAELLKRSGGH
jgi:ankyrin repeat protein